jgi:hypothetical protein
MPTRVGMSDLERLLDVRIFAMSLFCMFFTCFLVWSGRPEPSTDLCGPADRSPRPTRMHGDSNDEFRNNEVPSVCRICIKFYFDICYPSLVDYRQNRDSIDVTIVKTLRSLLYSYLCCKRACAEKPVAAEFFGDVTYPSPRIRRMFKFNVHDVIALCSQHLL